jgi:hypothetical protein
VYIHPNGARAGGAGSNGSALPLTHLLERGSGSVKYADKNGTYLRAGVVNLIKDLYSKLLKVLNLMSIIGRGELGHIHDCRLRLESNSTTTVEFNIFLDGTGRDRISSPSFKGI